MKSSFLSFAVALLTGLAASFSAMAQTTPLTGPTDDTEIFFSNQPLDPLEKPRVLFILDTSGSMGATVSGTGKSRLVNMIEALIGTTRALDNSATATGILNNPDIYNNIQAGFMQFSGFHDQQQVYYPMVDLSVTATSVEPGLDVTTLPENTARARMIQLVNVLTTGSGTPIVPTLLEAANFMRGSRVDLGATNGGGGVSHPFSYSPANTATPAGCNFQRPKSGTGTQCTSITGTPSYDTKLSINRGVPATQATLGCRRADYIIFLTDGEPTQNSAAVQTKIRTLTGAAACAANAGGGNGTCGIEIARWLNQRPLALGEVSNVPAASLDGDIVDGTSAYPIGATSSVSASKPGNQWVILHTIGFNLTDPDGFNFLQELATAGGGSRYEASNAAQLENVFTLILKAALNKTTSFATPSLATNVFNSLFSRNEIYTSLFVPSDRVRWHGNVKKYKLCAPNPTDTAEDCTITATGTICSVRNKAGTLTPCTFGDFVDASGATLVDPATGGIKASATDYWNLGTADGIKVQEGGAGGRLQAQVAAARELFTYTGQYEFEVNDGDPDPSNNRGGGRPLVGTSADLSLAVNSIDPAVAPSLGNLAITNSMLNAVSDAERSLILNWIRDPIDVGDEDKDTNVTEQIWRFEDPFHASALPIEYGGSGPNTKVYVPTNGGGLRMLNGDTGVEEWMFIPKELLPLQKILRANGPDTAGIGTRNYGLDAAPIAWIQDDNDNSSTNGIVPDGDLADGNDFARIILGQRDGGRSYYALDVINPAAPKLMWKIEGGKTAPPPPAPPGAAPVPITPGPAGGFADLGNTWSTPVLAKARVGSTVKTVLIFGGGHDKILSNKYGPNELSTAAAQKRIGNIVYIVDALTGALITSIGGTSGTDGAGNPTGTAVQVETAMRYPIVSQITAFDSSGDGTVDRLYFTDMGGNVWRVDLNTSLSVGGTFGNLSLLADLGTPDNGLEAPVPLAAGTRAFYFAPEVVQFDNPAFGGRFDMVAVSAGHRAHPLNLIVENAVYAIKDNRVFPLGDARNPNPNPVTYPVTQSALLDVTSNPLQQKDAAGAFVNQTALAQLATGPGWRLDLKESTGFIGEKGVSRPTVVGGKLFFTTYIPPGANTAANAAGSCQVVQGFGRTYAIDLLTAAALFANFDDNDSTLSTSDRYVQGIGMPSDLGVGVFPDGIVLPFVGPGPGGGGGPGGGAPCTDPSCPTGLNPGVSVPRGRIYWNER